MAKSPDKNTPAPVPTEEGAAETAPAPKKGKLKLIIIVVLAMAIGGGGAFAALKILGGNEKPVEAAAEGDVVNSPEAQPAPAADGEAPIVAPKKAGAESAAPAEGAPKGEGGAEGAPAADAGPQVIELKPFIVNLNDAGGKRFLKLTMGMKVDNQEMATELETNMPQIRDTILLLLSSLSYDDISTLDGKLRLRSQMINRTNTQMSSGKIKDIYFSEFVVQ